MPPPFNNCDCRRRHRDLNLYALTHISWVRGDGHRRGGRRLRKGHAGERQTAQDRNQEQRNRVQVSPRPSVEPPNAAAPAAKAITTQHPTAPEALNERSIVCLRCKHARAIAIAPAIANLVCQWFFNACVLCTTGAQKPRRRVHSKLPGPSSQRSLPGSFRRTWSMRRPRPS
jgi:hypothetical protein